MLSWATEGGLCVCVELRSDPAKGLWQQRKRDRVRGPCGQSWGQ